MSQFSMTPSSTFFTNLSVELFPKDSDVGSSHDLIVTTNDMPFFNKSITYVDPVTPPSSENLSLQKSN